jgi:hypothetical protein
LLKCDSCVPPGIFNASYHAWTSSRFTQPDKFMIMRKFPNTPPIARAAHVIARACWTPPWDLIRFQLSMAWGTWWGVEMMKYHHGGVLCAPKCIKLVQFFLAQPQKVNSTVKKLTFSAWVWVISGRKCKFINLKEKKVYQTSLQVKYFMISHCSV